MENEQFEQEGLPEEPEIVDNWNYEEVKYPAVGTISGFFNILAYLFLGAGVLAFVVTLANTMNSNTAEAMIMGVIALAAGGLSFLCFKAISELLIMFTDISFSAREILIHLTEKDTQVHSARYYDSSSDDPQ